MPTYILMIQAAHILIVRDDGSLVFRFDGADLDYALDTLANLQAPQIAEMVAEA